MKLLVFGLTVSSSWGNGHATLWRGLANAMAARGHTLVFLERGQPWYAESGDLTSLPAPGALILYGDWEEAVAVARDVLADHTADARVGNLLADQTRRGNAAAADALRAVDGGAR